MTGPRSDRRRRHRGPVRTDHQRLRLASAGDRAGVVHITGVGGLPVEGAGRVERVRVRVRGSTVADRVRIRRHVRHQARALVVRVDRVRDRPTGVRGRTTDRGRVVHRGTDRDRAQIRQRRRHRRAVRPDHQRLSTCRRWRPGRCCSHHRSRWPASRSVPDELNVCESESGAAPSLTAFGSGVTSATKLEHWSSE